MAKFYGEIGYAIPTETSPGVWQDKIVIRKYVGEVIKSMSRTRPDENLNDELALDNRLSIIADPFAYEKFHAMRYIEWMGAKWKINSVEANVRPRLILNIGGVYNEQRPEVEVASDP